MDFNVFLENIKRRVFYFYLIFFFIKFKQVQIPQNNSIEKEMKVYVKINSINYVGSFI